MKQTNK